MATITTSCLRPLITVRSNSPPHVCSPKILNIWVLGLAGKNEFEELIVEGIGDYHKEVYQDLAPYLYAKLGFRQEDPVMLFSQPSKFKFRLNIELASMKR